MKSFFNTASLDGTIYQCEEIQFTCEAFGNAEPPVKTFDFYHNGRLIVRRSKTGNFIIREVQKKDEGRYCCIPENKYGFGLNSSLDLKVIGKKSCFLMRSPTKKSGREHPDSHSKATLC